jgi:hypothetical protein
MGLTAAAALAPSISPQAMRARNFVVIDFILSLSFYK